LIDAEVLTADRPCGFGKELAYRLTTVDFNITVGAAPIDIDIVKLTTGGEEGESSSELE